MSQFKDTFTRGKSKESLLSYDNSASLIFSSALLAFVLVPCTLRFIYKFLFPDINSCSSSLRILSDADLDDYKVCGCETCANQRITRKNERSSILKRVDVSFINKLCFYILLWSILYVLVKNISDTSTIKAFDPFEILDIPHNGTLSQIKKAYRHKSMKYHPDRNPNDPDAAAHFILITKAYQALTDEVSRDNYQKYGNPDGPGIMKVGIGLPKFLVDENNQVVILSLFFLILLVVLPSLFFYLYQKHSKYASNGILMETLQIITHLMNPASRTKNMPDVFSQVKEFDELTMTDEDTPTLKNIVDYLSECKTKKTGFRSSSCVRVHVVLLAHMNRMHSFMNPNLNRVLKEILKYSILITHTMIEFALSQNWFLTAKSVLEFRRNIIQCLGSSDNNLMQIPHFNESIIKHVVRGKNAAHNMDEFIQQPSELRKGMNDLTPAQINDINSFMNHFPRMELVASVFVEGENLIVSGDVLTVKITMNRLNLSNENDKAGPIHAPLFPWIKFEEWWVFVTYKDEDRILTYTTFVSQNKLLEDKITFMLDRHGKVSIEIHAICDSYYGADKSTTVTFEAKPPHEVDLYPKIHPEDIELDNIPTTLESLIGEFTKTASSDSEECFDDDNIYVKGELNNSSNDEVSD